jgi:hypothetical protein
VYGNKMMLGEPILGPLTIPELTLIGIGLILIAMIIFNKMKPPRPPAAPSKKAIEDALTAARKMGLVDRISWAVH